MEFIYLPPDDDQPWPLTSGTQDDGIFFPPLWRFSRRFQLLAGVAMQHQYSVCVKCLSHSTNSIKTTKISARNGSVFLLKLTRRYHVVTEMLNAVSAVALLFRSKVPLLHILLNEINLGEMSTVFTASSINATLLILRIRCLTEYLQLTNITDE